MDPKAYWEQVDPPTSFAPEGWPYEDRRKFRYLLLPYLPKVANFKGYKGKRVLEVGCGSGIDAVEFACHGAIVTALDFSAKAVDLTSETFLETEQEGCVIQSDADNLPFDKGTFDLVYCFGVLHHIRNPVPAVNEIVRVLKPGGNVFAMLYHRDSLLYAYSILLRGEREGLTPDKAMRYYSERIGDCPYSKVYGRREAETLFSKSGLLRVEAVSYYPRLDAWDVNAPKRSLARKQQLFDRQRDVAPSYFGWHLIVQGKKP